MAFVKLSKREKQKMFSQGGWRERSIMQNLKCGATERKGMDGCVTFHSKDGRTATYYRGGRNGSPRWIN